MLMLDTYNSLYLTFINFTKINGLAIILKLFWWNRLSCWEQCCNYALFQEKIKAKLGIASLSYLGYSTWNNLPGNRKFAFSFSFCEHNIKNHFFLKIKWHSSRYLLLLFKKNYQTTLVTIVELVQNRASIILIFPLFKCQDSFPRFSVCLYDTILYDFLFH